MSNIPRTLYGANATPQSANANALDSFPILFDDNSNLTFHDGSHVAFHGAYQADLGSSGLGAVFAPRTVYSGEVEL